MAKVCSVIVFGALTAVGVQQFQGAPDPNLPVTMFVEKADKHAVAPMHFEKTPIGKYNPIKELEMNVAPAEIFAEPVHPRANFTNAEDVQEALEYLECEGRLTEPTSWFKDRVPPIAFATGKDPKPEWEYWTVLKGESCPRAHETEDGREAPCMFCYFDDRRCDMMLKRYPVQDVFPSARARFWTLSQGYRMDSLSQALSQAAALNETNPLAGKKIKGNEFKADICSLYFMYVFGGFRIDHDMVPAKNALWNYAMKPQKTTLIVNRLPYVMMGVEIGFTGARALHPVIEGNLKYIEKTIEMKDYLAICCEELYRNTHNYVKNYNMTWEQGVYTLPPGKAWNATDTTERFVILQDYWNRNAPHRVGDAVNYDGVVVARHINGYSAMFDTYRAKDKGFSLSVIFSWAQMTDRAGEYPEILAALKRDNAQFGSDTDWQTNHWDHEEHRYGRYIRMKIQKVIDWLREPDADIADYDVTYDENTVFTEEDLKLLDPLPGNETDAKQVLEDLKEKLRRPCMPSKSLTAHGKFISIKEKSQYHDKPLPGGPGAHFDNRYKDRIFWHHTVDQKLMREPSWVTWGIPQKKVMQNGSWGDHFLSFSTVRYPDIAEFQASYLQDHVDFYGGVMTWCEMNRGSGILWAPRVQPTKPTH